MVGRAGRARYGRRVAEAEMSRGKPRLFSASAPPFAGNLDYSADELGVADQPRAARKLAGARFRDDRYLPRKIRTTGMTG